MKDKTSTYIFMILSLIVACLFITLIYSQVKVTKVEIPEGRPKEAVEAEDSKSSGYEYDESQMWGKM